MLSVKEEIKYTYIHTEHMYHSSLFIHLLIFFYFYFFFKKVVSIVQFYVNDILKGLHKYLPGHWVRSYVYHHLSHILIFHLPPGAFCGLWSHIGQQAIWATHICLYPTRYPSQLGGLMWHNPMPGSNRRPWSYRDDALTNWAIAPNIYHYFTHSILNTDERCDCT